MIENLDYTIKFDILPSKLKLPIDNWRETPNIKIDELAKSMASVGLIQPPLVAINKLGEYVVIDGNRRTYAGKLLEKGYETTINDTPVTIKLPSNWRIMVLKKSYETLGEEEVSKLRYHSTENAEKFSNKAKFTNFRNELETFARERNLSIHKIMNNKILSNEIYEKLSKQYQLDILNIKKLVKLDADGVHYKDGVKEALYTQAIGVNLARGVSVGVPDSQIPDVLNVIKKYRDKGLNQSDIEDKLYPAKIEARENGEQIANILDKKLSNVKKTVTLTFAIPLELHQYLVGERTKQNICFSELLVPIIKKHYKLS